MKKSLKLLSVMLVAFLMTGCVKAHVNMEINKDKSMNLSLIAAINKSFLEQSGEEALMENEEIKNFEEKGFKTEKYLDDSMTGYKFTKKFANIDDLSSEKETTLDLNILADEETPNNIFTVKKGFFKNTYTVKMKNNATDELQSQIENAGQPTTTDDNQMNIQNDTNTSNDTTTQDDTTIQDSTDTQTDTDIQDDVTDTQSDGSFDFSNNMDMSMLSSAIDMKFNVNLPYKAISSNATSTENDGKTLVWNLVNTQDDIEFTFELYNMNNIYLTVGLAVILIILIIVIIIMSKRKPKAPLGTPVPVENTPVNNVVPNQAPVTPITNMPQTNIQENITPNVTSNQTINQMPVQNTEPIVQPQTQNNQATVQTQTIDNPQIQVNQNPVPAPSAPAPTESQPSPEIETLDISSTPNQPNNSLNNNTNIN